MADPRCQRYQPDVTRRDFLFRSGVGLGAIALQSLLAQRSAASPPPRRSRPSRPSCRRAKNAIFLFMEGGPSHIDLFDPKPLLNELAGQPLPASFGDVITAMGEAKSPLLASPRQWKQHGAGGAVDQRLAAAPRGARGRSGRDPFLLGRRHQSLRGRLPDEYRIDSRRATVVGSVGHLWLGDRKRRPSRLRGPARQPGQRGQRTSQLECRVHAGRLPGNPHPGR